jgi:hypothetical protein
MFQNQKSKITVLQHFFVTEISKRSFDFGTSQLIVPALNIKTLKKNLRLRETFLKKGAGVIYSLFSTF